MRRAAKRRVRAVVAARQPQRIDLPHGRWGLGTAADGSLSLHGVRLGELIERFGSPLHVVDAEALDRNASDARAAVDGPGGVDAFYSYKTNPIPAVLRRLHGRGIGAEVISPYELWLARELGVPAERIIYNGPAKSYESIREAIEAGVLVINANSEGDYRQIVRAADETGSRAAVGFRVALPDMWGGQFGMSSTSGVVDGLVVDAVGRERIDPVGLHFHRGVTIRTEAELVGYLSSVLAYVDGLEQRTGWRPTILDIGGSLSVPSVAPFPRRQFRLNRALATDLLPPDPSTAITIGDAVQRIRTIVTDHYAGRGAPPRVVVEPGRALTGNTQMLLTSVHDVKRDGVVVHAVLDAGINIAQTMQGEYHQIFHVSRPTAPVHESYRLAGPICTPADVLANNWRLPELEPGDVLAIMDAGAYFVPFSTSFSFPRPAIVMTDSGSVSLVRRAETFDDLVRNDVATDVSAVES